MNGQDNRIRITDPTHGLCLGGGLSWQSYIVWNPRHLTVALGEKDGPLSQEGKPLGMDLINVSISLMRGDKKLGFM